MAYTEQGESSQKGAQNNKRPTCNHCGKLGHTSKKCCSNGKCYSYNKNGHTGSQCTYKTKFEGKCFTCNKQGHKSLEHRTKK